MEIMKIAVMSDSHDNWENLSQAVRQANDLDCEVLLHAGDLVAPAGVAVLQDFRGKVKFVWGNNETEQVEITRQMTVADMEVFDRFEGQIGGLAVFMSHYPQPAETASLSESFDLCVHGHTHQYREERVDNKEGQVAKTLILNPGEIQGYRTGQASFAVVSFVVKKSSQASPRISAQRIDL